MQKTIRVMVLVFTLLGLSTFVLGQAETGQITGTIHDPSGAVVSNATVIAKSVASGTTRQTVTNSTGNFTMSNLKPDTYDVTVTAAGFKSVTKRVAVAVGLPSDGSMAMELGSSNQTIEVSADAAEIVAVNTENQQLSEVIGSQQIENLPSLNRNPYTFVATAGNVSTADASGRGVGVAINGQRSASTDVLLDGGENVDAFTASVGQSVPLDSVQELSVTTNAFTAELGRAGGGVVNVATKSGTNAFHGSAYEFNRTSATTANTFQNNADTIDKPKYTRNQFGYSVGGPIVKNKMFFFSSTEWTRVRSTGTRTEVVLDPASVATLPANAQAFINAGKIRPSATLVGTTTSGGLLFDEYSFGVPSDAGGGSPQNTYTDVQRLDWNITDKTTIYGRYALQSNLYFPGSVGYSVYQGFDTGETDYNNNVLVSLTHVWGNSLVTQTKGIFNRLNQSQPLGSAPVQPTLYTTPSSALPLGSGRLVFPGYLPTSPGSAIPFGGPQNMYEGYQDINWTHGKHQFRFGGQYLQLRDNRTFGAYEEAVEALSSGKLADALTNLKAGQLYQFSAAVDPQGKFPCAKTSTGATIVTPACTVTLPVGPPQFGRHNRFHDGAAYAQDSWKVTPRFTLNLGVRWEYYGTLDPQEPNLTSNFYPGSGSTLVQRIQNGTVQISKNSPNGNVWEPNKRNFAPRLGFAWDITGDGRTSLRGGYGIGYERNFGNVTFNIIQNPPAYAVLNLQSSDVGGNLPITTNNAGPLAGTGTKALPQTSLRAVDPNIKSAYTESYNLSLEREVFKNTVVSLEYVGARGVHLYDIANVNPTHSGSIYGGYASASSRINLANSSVNFRGSNGMSSYNGLNTHFKTVMPKHGLTLNANYTWSHSLDNLSSTFSEGVDGNFVLGYLNPYMPEFDYGNSEFDIRQRVVVSGTWDIPGFKNSNKFLKGVFGGWGLSPIYEAHTGQPYSMYDCTNGVNQCPRWNPGGAVPLDGSFSLSSFPKDSTGAAASSNTYIWKTFPATGIGNTTDLASCVTPGVGCTMTPMMERNQFRGPGFWNLDLGVTKKFNITERVGLTFRSEFYNIFNHHNAYLIGGFNEVTSTIDATNPNPQMYVAKGVPTSGAADERRFIQFGLRLTF